VSLARVGFIAIPPGAKPGFDHADVHRELRRLYVAHTGADRIDVLDCNARTYLRALPAELPGVAGVLIDEEHDLLFSSDRGAARVSVFRCSDERLLGQTEVGPHPNGLAYDRQRRHLYSFNLGEPLGENCTASVVELDSLRVISELPLPGRPRWAVYDPQRDVVYANIQKPAQIVGASGRSDIAARIGCWVDSAVRAPQLSGVAHIGGSRF
jgi:DNA-binding beta-propeller fold protein YncE